MSFVIWAGGILAALFFLALLYLGCVAAVQLAKLQAAVMKHRASSRRVEDDRELYRAAGFEP
jgi:hypothetical protein